MSSKRLYRVIFLNQGQVYEIYARQVSQADLYGFVTVSDLVFGEKSSLVIDPSEERLKGEFEGVNHTNIPIHAVIRIDEVEKQGVAKIVELSSKGGTVTGFPGTPLPPSGGTKP